MADTLDILGHEEVHGHVDNDRGRNHEFKAVPTKVPGATTDSVSRTSGKYLLTQAQTAHTLLDLSSITRDGENSRRQIQKAFEVCETIDKYLAILDLEPELRQQIERAKDALEARLYEFESRRAIVR